jgi:putative SOS response-associated peptidase YedK
VITGPANADVQPISIRMPLELGRSDIDDWIDPELHDREVLEAMLTPVLDGTYRRSRMRIPGLRL